jgi:Na+/H+ antiporter NhaD/arsenite permease-like protein
MAANTASAVLVSSNPTNILITGSFDLNYLTDFTKWTILPSIVPAVLNYGVILAMFWTKIPKTIVPLQDDPWSKLRDRTGAIFLTTLMLVTVAVLVGTSFVPGHAVEVWMVTAPAGISALLYNVVRDVRDPASRNRMTSLKEDDPAAETGPLDRTGSNISKQNTRGINEAAWHGPAQDSPASLSEKQVRPSPNGGIDGSDLPASKEDTDLHLPSSGASSPPQDAKDKPTLHAEPTFLSFIRRVSARLPSTTRTVTRLPIPLLPFAMCEFIMVRGLAQRGWIHIFALGFAHICTNPAATVFFLGFLCSAVLCPLAGTNIGATIILVEILRDPAFSQSQAVIQDRRVLLGAIYAVAMGSNLGAFSFTFAGSLAGLLWRGLLSNSAAGRIEVSQWKFARINAVPLVMQTGVACAIIVGQLYWFA